MKGSIGENGAHKLVFQQDSLAAPLSNLQSNIDKARVLEGLSNSNSVGPNLVPMNQLSK